MIEMLIAGLAFGLLMGWFLARIKNDTELEELNDLIREQQELILLQKKYIEQNGWRKAMRIDERARRLEKHCHMCNRMELMTSNGLLVVKIFDDHGKAVRVTYKDGEPVDIQKAPDDMLRPIKTKSNEITFGGF